MQNDSGQRLPVWIGRKLPTGLAGAVFWLAVWFCLLFLLRMIPGYAGSFFTIVQILVGIALAATGIPLLVRVIRRRMLWSLRNKLVVTYLLIGLAPVVLFMTLVAISSYVAAGQFAIHLADSRIQEELAQMSSDNAHRIEWISHLVETKQLSPSAANIPELNDGLDVARARLHRESSVYINGAPIALGAVHGKVPVGLPPWAAELKSGQFDGLVLDGDDLYLTAINQRRLNDGRSLSLVSSLVVDSQLLDVIARGLGRVQLVAESSGNDSEENKEAATKVSSRRQALRERIRRGRQSSISGGAQSPSVNLADIQVSFISAVDVTDWGSGERDSIPIGVRSRPSQLYNQLFGASLRSRFTNAYRFGLIALCVLFTLIELLDPAEPNDDEFGGGPLRCDSEDRSGRVQSSHWCDTSGPAGRVEPLF